MGLFSGDIYAPSLAATTHLNVILPEESEDVWPLEEGEPRILYLLHGLGSNADEWPRFSRIEYFAKLYNLVVVMPEVGRGFYTDMATGPSFLSYVTRDLPAFVHDWFRVPTARDRTFIAGESMGGYGAVKAALTRPDLYAGFASLSGVMDVAEMRGWVEDGTWDAMRPDEMTSLFGEGPGVSQADDLSKLVRSRADDADRPRFIQLCGTEDFLIEMNRAFSTETEAVGYEHTYMEWSGAHNWTFWDVAIQRSIQFLLGYDPHDAPLA